MEIAAQVLRGADCLVAALADCTGESGLNESRYRVLLALHHWMNGECSQAELAAALLQSESNLSTLLERMSGDGLITRIRSQTDRRRSLIRMTPHGNESLLQAERIRAAALMQLLRNLCAEEGRSLSEGLRRLVSELEAALEIAPRRTSIASSAHR
jgi:DNA-binding MarR family transcriptional regulator